MEGLFSPCTPRLQDMIEDIVQQREHEDNITYERPDCNFEAINELNLDISTDEFLSAGRAFTYGDLHAMLENEDTLAWLTPHAAVARDGGLAVIAWEQQLDQELSCFYFSVDGEGLVGCLMASSPEYLLEICDVVLRLLAVSLVQSLRLNDMSCLEFLIKAAVWRI
jgi:hypothetical protein